MFKTLHMPHRCGQLKGMALFVIVLCLYSLIVLRISENINDPYLWYDEGGNSGIAKGLNHDSAPMQASRGVAEILAKQCPLQL